ncbi:MAG TPA: valine--tRNA ligase [Nitrososphaeraceae archaeon]|jgi:valyl-tRNA synthetase
MNENRKIESTSWDPSLELKILDKWCKDDVYSYSDSNLNSTPFVIDTPPPYPSGRPWHIGAAAHYAQIDMIARTARMRDYLVYFPIGIDRNGLPVEIYTEKKYKIQMRKTDREKFLDLCSHALDDLESEMLQIMRDIGISGNFDEYYKTDSAEFRELTQSTFIDLWKRDLIYIANRPNNYCYDCGTTLADAEITYHEIPTQLVYMKFDVKENGSIIVASTRPELLFACQAIIVNPEDDRYSGLVGKHAVLPLFDRQVEILSHPTANISFGSGAVMVCSYGDRNDVQLFRELGLQEIVSLTEYGTTTEMAKSYAKLKISQARSKIIEDLRKDQRVEREENIMHRTPICERSRTPIEILSMQDYYLKQMTFIPTLKKLSLRIKFYPEEHRQILNNWLESVSIDWPISRRRFYGTEIPIWFCNACNTPNVPEAGQYYRPWKEKPPFKCCSKCGSNDFTGEDRIFDTWMDSSITPLFITRYLRDQKIYEHLYPTSLRPQAKDIIRTWLYYSMLRCYQQTDRLPWSEAWIMGYGVDEKGEKMSKSKGNVIDPFPIIHKYGADAFRFWSASEGNLGQDFRCSEQRIAISKNFLSKLWNIARFVSSFRITLDLPQQLNDSDKWILGELSKLIKECELGYNDYNFFIPANAIKDFTWNLFASNYLEMVKWRVYEGENKYDHESAIFTVNKCLSTILLLLCPICPFITEEIWTNMYSDTSIHLQKMPKLETEFQEQTKYTKSLLEFNSLVWTRKKETISPETGKPLSLKDPIQMEIPTTIISFAPDLRKMHNLK